MNKLLLIILILYVCLMHSKSHEDWDEGKEEERRIIRQMIWDERRRLQEQVDEMRKL